MKISVIGCGYLGAVHAASMAQLGHDVVGIDVDQPKVEALSARQGAVLRARLRRAAERDAGHRAGCAFTTDIADAAGAQVHFVCVGTPQKRGEYAADLRYVEAAVESLLAVLAPGRPRRREVDRAGGHGGAAGRAGRGQGARRAAGLEPGVPARGLRRPGHPAPRPAGLRPAGRRRRRDRRARCSTRSTRRSSRAGTPQVVTDYATAEMVKTAANSFLATKISFINAMAELCEATGADVKQLADAIGYDDRIGRKFLNAGLGFGGGCLPKDIRAFMARAGELGADQALTFLREVDNINMRRRIRMVELAREVCDGSPARQAGRRAGCGVQARTATTSATRRRSTSPRSCSCRAPSVRVTDPAAVENSRRLWPQLDYADTARGGGRAGGRRAACSPSGSSTASWTRWRSAGSSRRSGCSTGATRSTGPAGRPPAGATGRWDGGTLP